MFKMKCSFIVYCMKVSQMLLIFVSWQICPPKILNFIAYICTYLLNMNKKFCKHSDIYSYNCETSKDYCGTVFFICVQIKMIVFNESPLKPI